MKFVIKENERGFLFRHGVFTQLLEPGGNLLAQLQELVR